MEISQQHGLIEELIAKNHPLFTKELNNGNELKIATRLDREQGDFKTISREDNKNRYYLDPAGAAFKAGNLKLDKAGGLSRAIYNYKKIKECYEEKTINDFFPINKDAKGRKGQKPINMKEGDVFTVKGGDGKIPLNIIHCMSYSLSGKNEENSKKGLEKSVYHFASSSLRAALKGRNKNSEEVEFMVPFFSGNIYGSEYFSKNPAEYNKIFIEAIVKAVKEKLKEKDCPKFKITIYNKGNKKGFNDILRDTINNSEIISKLAQQRDEPTTTQNIPEKKNGDPDDEVLLSAEEEDDIKIDDGKDAVGDRYADKDEIALDTQSHLAGNDEKEESAQSHSTTKDGKHKSIRGSNDTDLKQYKKKKNTAIISGSVIILVALVIFSGVLLYILKFSNFTTKNKNIGIAINSVVAIAVLAFTGVYFSISTLKKEGVSNNKLQNTKSTSVVENDAPTIGAQ